MDAIRFNGVAGLLMDMDGTLVDSEHVSDRCWAEWCDRRGRDLASVLPQSRGRQGVEVMAQVAPELTAAELRADADAFTSAEIADTDGVVGTPGADRLLVGLREQGVPFALVTSAIRPLATARMVAAGLGMPVVAICGDEVTAGKPDPDGYLRAASALGLDPAQCLVLEDATSGIEAGQAAGARVIALGSGPHPGADAWIRTLDELRVHRDEVGFVVDLLRSDTLD